MKKIIWILLFMWIGFIFYNSCQIGADSTSASDVIVYWVIETTKAPLTWYQQISLLVRKGAHFTEYALLGFSSVLAQTISPLKVFSNTKYLLVFLLVPFIDETIQAFVPGRNNSIIDVGIDSLGFLTGFTICLFIIKYFKRRK